QYSFVASRRRHTRFSRDWSSDVCSSDLGPVQAGETITADMLAMRRRDMAGAGDGFADPAALVGQTANRSLAPGAAPTADDVVERSEERRVGEEARSRVTAERCKNTADDE